MQAIVSMTVLMAPLTAKKSERNDMRCAAKDVSSRVTLLGSRVGLMPEAGGNTTSCLAIVGGKQRTQCIE
eukprot:scaffold206438_cov17-Prasinocladus_malaysianus.AAC.1